MIFEPHTDIIRKDRRDTLYGHKVFLTGGASGLIVDCFVERGNPTDSTKAVKLAERRSRDGRARLRSVRARQDVDVSVLQTELPR